MKLCLFIKTNIRTILEGVIIVMLMLLAGLEDFSLGALPYIFTCLGVIFLNTYLLEKY